VFALLQNRVLKAALASMSFANLSDALRQYILQHVGPGEWAFAAPVSEGFKADYLSASAAISGKPVSAPDHRKTFYSAAMASVARLQEAINNGLIGEEFTAEGQAHPYRVAFSAGQFADRDKLLWLKATCTSLWCEALCKGAIQSGRLDVLEWLHEAQQCPWSFTAGCLAARHNKLAVLQYIYSKHDGGVPEPNAERAQRVEFSLSAVESDSTELLQWCHDRQLLCDSTGSEERLHARAVRLLHFTAAAWFQEHGFESTLQHQLAVAVAQLRKLEQQQEQLLQAGLRCCSRLVRY
jgi:hypothetical protein